MGIKKKPIEFIYKEPLMCHLDRNPRRKNEGRN